MQVKLEVKLEYDGIWSSFGGVSDVGAGGLHLAGTPSLCRTINPQHKDFEGTYFNRRATFISHAAYLTIWNGWGLSIYADADFVRTKSSLECWIHSKCQFEIL